MDTTTTKCKKCEQEFDSIYDIDEGVCDECWEKRKYKSSQDFANSLEFNTKGERFRDYGTLVLAYSDVKRKGIESSYYKHAKKGGDIEILREFDILIGEIQKWK